MLRAVRFAATFGFRARRRGPGGHRRDGRRNPRRQPRADRHGDAAAAGRSQPGGRRAADAGDRAGGGSAAGDRAPRRRPAATARRHAGIALAVGRRVRLSAGPGRAVVSVRRRRRGGRRVPALAAVEQGDASESAGSWRITTALADARAMRWSALQPLLVAEGIDDLLALIEAASPAGAEAAAYCRSLLAPAPRGARSAAAADRRRSAGPRDSVRAASTRRCCSASAPPSWTERFAPRPRRWRWWRSGGELVVSDELGRRKEAVAKPPAEAGGLRLRCLERSVPIDRLNFRVDTRNNE